MSLKNKTKAELLEEVADLRKEIRKIRSSGRKTDFDLSVLTSEKNQILDSISEHVIIQDTRHRIIWANKSAHKSVGLKPNALSGQVCHAVWQKRKTPCPECPVAKAVKTGKPHQEEVSSPDGRFWEVHGYPLKNKQGQVNGAVEVTLQITDKKQTEFRLRDEQALLTQISDTSPVAIVVVNKEGQITFANKHAEQVLGLSKEKITKRTYNDPKWKITDYEGNPYSDKKLPFQLVKSTGKPVSDIHHAITWPDGRRILLSINAAPLFDEKGKFNGIVAAMEDVTWRVRSEKALRESEASMRSLFRAAPIGIGMVTDQIIQTVNEEMCRMTGYTKEELIGKSSRLMYSSHKEFQRVGKVTYTDIKKSSKGVIETKLKRKDGTIINALVSSSPIDPKDLSRGIIFTVRDITEQKNAEKDLQKARQEWEDIFQAIGHPAFILDKSHRIIHANKATSKVTGLSTKKILGRKCFQVFHRRNSPAECCPAESLIKSGETKTIEMEMEALEGTFLVSCTPVLDDRGKVKNIIHIATDITEKKRAQENLTRVKVHYQDLFDSASDAIFIHKPDGTMLDINRRACEHLGYTRQELLKLTPMDFDSLKYAPLVKQRIDRLLKKGHLLFETEHTRKDGSIVPVEISSQLVDYYGQQAILSHARDITERKQAEKALVESEERYKGVVETSPDSILLIGLDRKLLLYNEGFLKMHGYRPEDDPTGEDSFLFLAPEERPRAERQIKQILDDGPMKNAEYTMLKKDGSRFLAEVSGSLHLDPDGKPLGIVLVARDITDRKLAEERFQVAAEISSDYIYEWDVQKDTLVWFGGINEGLGYDPGTIPPTISGWVNLIHPDDQKRLKNAVEDHRSITKPIYEEYRIRHADGSWRHWIDRGSPLLDHKGKPYKWIGSCIDITQQKQAENNLRESEEKIRTLYENIAIGMYRTTPDGKILMANPALIKLLGFRSFEEFKKRDLEKAGFEPDYPRKKFKEEIDTKGEIIGWEAAWHRKDGRTIYVRESARLVRDEKGRPLFYEGTVEDITGRKETELRLRESEEKFRSIAENSFDVIFSFDLKGRVTYASPAVERVTGYKPEEVTGRSFRNFVKRSMLPKAVRIFTTLLSGKIVEDFEMDIICKGKKTKSIEATVTPIFKGEKVIGAQGLVSDITERKKAEEKIRESEERYRDLVEKAGIAILMDDREGNLIYFNKEFLKLFGFTQKEIKRRTIGSVVHPDDRDKVMAIHRDRLQGKRVPTRYEFRGIRKDGSVIFLEVDAVALKHNGEFTGSRSYIWDITQRKIAEEKIKTSLQEKEVMLKEIHHRVKNNMQIMSSLLRLQTRRIRNKAMEEKLERFHDRIKSMALIHERLYSSEDLAHINFAEYIKDLSSYLRLSYGGDGRRITIKAEAKDVFLDINKAIPCGLIINELISNSLKHAFKERRSGRISIQFSRPKEDSYRIIVSDNGVGFPDGVNFEEPDSLGLQLVNDLVKQLRGTLTLDRTEGTTFTVEF